MKKIALFLLVSSFFYQAEAQVTYHDIMPDTTVSGWDAYSFGIAGSPRTAFFIWQHNFSPDEVLVTSNSGAEVLMTVSGGSVFPQSLASGQLISSNSTGRWEQGAYDTLCKSGFGNWCGATDMYLGIRYKQGASSYYGWLRMDVAENSTSFTVKDYAWNTIADSGLRAGHKTLATKVARSKALQGVSSQIMHGMLHLKGLPNGLQVKASMLDATGRRVAAATMNGAAQMDLRHLASGSYILVLQAGDERKTLRVVL